MCLALPLCIDSIISDTLARVRQGNDFLDIDISMVESVRVGDYVIVHAGYAIEVLDPPEAELRLGLFSDLKAQNDAG